LRAVEITSAVDDLLAAHRAFNNFHTEPPLARELQRLVGNKGNIPSQASRYYVHGLVEIFLTNGSGIAWSADSIYRALWAQFTPDQAVIAILSFQEDTIASQLQFSLGKEHYQELLTLMRGHVSAPVVGELIDHIEGYTGPIFRMRDDARFMSRIAPLQVILDGTGA